MNNAYDWGGSKKRKQSGRWETHRTCVHNLENGNFQEESWDPFYEMRWRGRDGKDE